MKISVQVRVEGTIDVPGEWTDDTVEADPDAFDEAILSALPDQMSACRITVEEAFVE